jgi:hypothetical protein
MTVNKTPHEQSISTPAKPNYSFRTCTYELFSQHEVIEGAKDGHNNGQNCIKMEELVGFSNIHAGSHAAVVRQVVPVRHS